MGSMQPLGLWFSGRPSLHGGTEHGTVGNYVVPQPSDIAEVSHKVIMTEFRLHLPKRTKEWYNDRRFLLEID